MSKYITKMFKILHTIFQTKQKITRQLQTNVVKLQLKNLLKIVENIGNIK